MNENEDNKKKKIKKEIKILEEIVVKKQYFHFSKEKMKVSVIITTYNAVEWLQKVLIGYSVQTECDFEIVIADDGSTSETKDLISQFSSKFKNPIIHVWHEDKGFRKSEILNKAKSVIFIFKLITINEGRTGIGIFEKLKN